MSGRRKHQKLDSARSPKQLNSFTTVTLPKTEAAKNLKGLSLRAKITLGAIAIGVIPVAIVGIVADRVAERYVTQQIIQAKISRTQFMAQRLEKLLSDRASEAEAFANNQIFTNPNLSQIVTLNQKKAELNAFKDKLGFYDSIIYFDLQGNPLFQSRANRPLRENYSDRQYFQDAIATKQITINQPRLSSSSERLLVEVAVPVKDAWSSQIIGIMGFRIAREKINSILTAYVEENEKWHLIDTKGTFFASVQSNLLNQHIDNYYPHLQPLHQSQKMSAAVVPNPVEPEQQQLVSYVPISIRDIGSPLNLGVVTAIDKDVALAPIMHLRWSFLVITLTSITIVGAIALYFANRLVRPLLKLTSAVGRLSQGQLNTRIKITRQDELALLGTRINYMAEQLQNLLQRQRSVAQTSELLSKMAQARNLRELQLPFNLFLNEVRSLIKSDRVIFYQFDASWQGTVIAESVGQSWSRALGAEFKDPCFAENYVRKYQRGRIQAISDIYAANLTECHLKQLEPFAVKASLVLPVITDGQTTRDEEKLIGLLIVHQCSGTRVWQESDVEYCLQIAYQLGMVLRGYVFLREENLQKANLRADISQLLQSLEGLSDGNLTVNATSSTSAIKDIADFFNIVVKNARHTISEVEEIAQTIDGELLLNQEDLMQLKGELSVQANRFVFTLKAIEQLAIAIETVTEKTEIVTQKMKLAATKVESGQANVKLVVDNTSQLAAIVENITSKIKPLDLAFQRMNRAIGILSEINLRLSLLFGKLKERSFSDGDWVETFQQQQELVPKLIAGVRELEIIGHDIETQIAETIKNLETSTVDVLGKTLIAEATNKDLAQIAKIIDNVRQMLGSIIDTANRQLETTQKLLQLKPNITRTSKLFTELHHRSCNSLDTIAISTKNLQQIVDRFKIDSGDDA